MPGKYVPSFLKDQSGSSNATATATATTIGTNNRFAVLSEDGWTSKPLVNTSRPAKEAPKLVPATLASLTSSNGGAGATGVSFAARFAEQARIAEDPDYKPAPKPLNIQSQDDFPTLGSSNRGGKKTIAVAPPPIPVATKPKFADLAKDWADNHQEIELAKEQQRIVEEHLRTEAMARKAGIVRRRHYFGIDDDLSCDYYDEDDEKNSVDDDSNSYAASEGDGEDEFLSSEEEKEQQYAEHNAYLMTIGWKG